MVVLLDLDEDALDPNTAPRDPTRPSQSFDRARTIKLPEDQTPSLNNNGFSAALACYPYASLCEPLTRRDWLIP